jgi:hypothetical protein
MVINFLFTVVAPFLGFKPITFYLTRSDFRVYFFSALIQKQTVCQKSLNFKTQIYGSDFKQNIPEFAFRRSRKTPYLFVSLKKSAQFLSSQAGYLGSNYPNSGRI